MLVVIDPTTGGALDVWTGSATAAEVATILAHAVAPAASPADASLRRGDALLASGDSGAAVTAYDEALATGGLTWPGRPHALEQLVSAAAADPRTCVNRVAREAPALRREHPFVSLALTGVQCLRGDLALVGSPDGAQVEPLAREALDLPSASEDERYMLFEALHAIRKQVGDVAGARAIATRYYAYASTRPPGTSLDLRMARDQAVLRAAVKLGTPDTVIARLETSDRELADAPAAERLASAYSAAQRYPDAIAAATRGLARNPGPSEQVRLFVQRAGNEVHTGDVTSARHDLDEATQLIPRIGVPGERDVARSQIEAQRAALP